jgi:nitrile hydratase
VTDALPARFAPGDRVTVRQAHPPGHLRTPFYARGASGVVERLCGAFANPEELAFNRPGLPAQPLYRVRFRQAELWDGYDGPARDTIEIEIYQHWLEAAP